MHLPHEIMINASVMQQGNFIDVSLARHVSVILQLYYIIFRLHYQEH